MPLYEYRCKDCGHQFEKIQSFSAPEEKVCPACKGELEKLISRSAIQFKGAGWYVNDYAAKSGSKPAAKSGDSGGSGDSSSASPASSTESAGKASSGSDSSAGSTTSSPAPAASPSTKSE